MSKMFQLKATILHFFLFAITITYAKTDYKVQITFFMHDIIGGSTPSERIVAGIITNTETTKIPFSKPNNRVLPIKGSIPLFDTSINNGFSPITRSTKSVFRNIGKNKVIIIDDRDLLPYVTPNQVPIGATLGNLLFGRITVIDDEITKGHEFGSEVIGKAQGFHLASSLDGSSRTMTFSALFHSEDHEKNEEKEDAISFFGVHETGAKESFLAVVGGTGKYCNAKGYAKIETLHDLPDQHITNGVETVLQITVFLS